MTQEDEELIFIDLCARLPYGGVYVKDIRQGTRVCKIYEIKPSRICCLTLIPISDSYYYQEYPCDIVSVKPYLRPMSSMTEEEKKEYEKVCELDTKILANHPMNGEPFPALYNSQDWLNKNMFDYRGLIPRGLAIEVGEDNNPYK